MFRISGHVVVVVVKRERETKENLPAIIYNNSANAIDLRERDDGRLGQLEREVDCILYSVMLYSLYSYHCLVDDKQPTA